MGVYIKGVEIPTDNTVLLRIYPKGNDGEFYVEQLDIDDDILDEYWAVPVPPHGRLIDADEIDNERIYRESYERDGSFSLIYTKDEFPTIIPAEKGGDT